MASKHYLRQKLSTLNLVHANFESSFIDTSVPVLEFAIIRLFIIDLIGLMKNKVALSKNFYIAPSEVDRMYYWEYEYMLDIVNDNIKKENENAEREQAKYGDMNPKSMARNMSSHMQKTPSFNVPKMPSFGH